MSLPVVRLGVVGRSFSASGETEEGIKWKVSAEAENLDSARALVHISGLLVADVTVHTRYGTIGGLAEEVQNISSVLVWGAIHALEELG